MEDDLGAPQMQSHVYYKSLEILTVEKGVTNSKVKVTSMNGARTTGQPMQKKKTPTLK